MHYKTDLLTDEQMAHFEVKVGDELVLDVPNVSGEVSQQRCQVIAVEIEDAGKHPETGKHLTRVTLTLS